MSNHFQNNVGYPLYPFLPIQVQSTIILPAEYKVLFLFVSVLPIQIQSTLILPAEYKVHFLFVPALSVDLLEFKKIRVKLIITEQEQESYSQESLFQHLLLRKRLHKLYGIITTL